MQFIRSKTVRKTSLFFIALIPDRALRIKIYNIKRDFKRFGSIKALEVYPHITLKSSFICSGNDKNKFLNWFSELVVRQDSFLINLNSFGAFYNKHSPVIFINPVISSELIKIQRELMIGFNSILPAYVHEVDRKFKPHVTVAYRDLSWENFLRAWKEYKHKPFNDVFDVHAIYLLEHDGSDWNLIATHNLD